IFSGRRPFSGQTIADTLAAIMTATPDWSLLPATLPGEVVNLIRGCLDKDRRTRVGDLAVARFLLSGSLAAADRVNARPSSSRSALGWLAPWLIAGAAVAAAIALAIHSRPDSETAAARPVSFEVGLPAGVELSGLQNSTSPAISPDGRRVAFVA